MTTDDYLNLITSAFRDKPKFTAMIAADTGFLVRVQDLMTSMIPKFDVDIAEGDQLDIIGLWVGVTREVNVPIEGVFFTWDGDYTVGWDFGTWRSDSNATSITVLPDDAYRTLIKAKIAANSWDGTTDGAYAIWDAVFATVTILIIDHQDMSYDLALVGGIVDSLTLALLTGGYIPLKPEGVRVNSYLVPVDANPLFGWDIENEYVNGWDQGSWPREIVPT